MGLSVGCVQQGMPGTERRAAYLADITYVTSKEAGFDHQRDCLVGRDSGNNYRIKSPISNRQSKSIVHFQSTNLQ